MKALNSILNRDQEQFIDGLWLECKCEDYLLMNEKDCAIQKGILMASEEEKTQVKEMIKSLYEFANIPLHWNGEVNEQVAEVFGIMINETTKCSKAFRWVPTPPGGRSSIAWLVMQFGRGLFNHYRSQLSFVCAQTVIYKWNRQLEMALMGLSAGRLQEWA